MNITLSNIIKTVAPGLAALLGGPLAGGIVSLLGNAILGNSNASEQDVATALSNPANLVRLKEIEAQLYMADLASEDRDKERQAEVNKVEASSDNLFKSGWRPAIGWVGALGMAYNYLIVPVCVTFGLPAVNLDMNTLMPLVMALLGLGAMRSWDRTKGK